MRQGSIQTEGVGVSGVFTATAWLKNILFAHTSPTLAVPDGEVTLREEVAY